MKTETLKTQCFVFAIGRTDGTWTKESVESTTIMGAQSKIYHMYPSDSYPDILFRVFLNSENEDKVAI